MVIAYIGLGANLGQAQTTLIQAASELALAPGIEALQLSPFYRTAPIDSSGPDYVNAAARIETTLAPLALLDVLQAIEAKHGRLRPYRNAPRTLDLDLLLYGDLSINLPRLVVPHPRMHERAFVLRPLSDLDPGLLLAQGPLDVLLTLYADQGLQRMP